MTMPTNWLDNPIFVKHLRSRLRRAQFVPPAVVVGVICICISYAGYQLNWFKNGWAFGALLGLQGVLLAIMGASQVASSVGGARESGILDFHRVSPLSPLTVTLGFFFGAPIREYALCGLTLPFILICAADDSPGPVGVFQSTVVLLLSAWTLHALALLTSLSSKKPKAGTRGIVGIMVFLFIFGGQFGFMGLSRAAAFLGESPTSSFFGLTIPWLLSTVIYTLPSLFFLLLASTRKMRSERAHSFTKPQAIACMAVQGFLLLGGLWGQSQFRGMTLLAIYLLSAFACILTMTITPNLGEFTKGIRRVERQGRKAITWTDDLGLNRVAVLILSAIVLAISTVIWYVPESMVEQFNPPGPGGPVNYSISIATAVLTVAYFGLALQFFMLVAPKRGATIMGLFILLAWVVPIVVGSILGASGAGDKLGQIIVSLSPVVGIGVSADLSPDVGSTGMQAAALCPALVFALLFNNAVTWARRRAIDRIHATPGIAKPEVEPEALAV